MLRRTLRTPASWILFALIGFAAPAAAQTPLTITINGPAAAGITYRGSFNYRVSIQNTGATAATNVQIDAFVAPSIVQGSAAGNVSINPTVGTPTGCALTAGAYPCVVASIAAGATATVTFPVSWASPDPAFEAPTEVEACPSAVAASNAANFATADLSWDGGGSTASVTSAVSAFFRDYANLQLDAVLAPASEGATKTHSGSVTNLGPCDTTSVAVELTYSYNSSTDLDPATTGTQGAYTGCVNDFVADEVCELGDLAVGATSAGFSIDIRVQTFPKDMVSSPVDVGFSATSDLDDKGDTFSASRRDILDLGGDAGWGCSTGPGLGIFSLLSLAVLGLRRRRRA